MANSLILIYCLVALCNIYSVAACNDEHCELLCQFGFLIKDGCKICECNLDPCKGECKDDIEYCDYSKKCILELCPLDEFAKPICKSICDLPKDAGPCKAYMPRYYYDSSTNKCIEFIYGGCRGNQNNFYTKDQCEKVCKKPCPLLYCKTCEFGNVVDQNGCTTCECKPNPCSYVKCPANTYCSIEYHRNCTHFPCFEVKCKSICTLPVLPGPCRASIPRYYYDEITNSCKLFTYGGCKGNQNNFYTKDQCEKVCKKPCPLLKCKTCEFGNVVDQNGCTTCECKPNPCSLVRCPANTYCSLEYHDNCKHFPCISVKCKSICTLPVLPGPCKGSFPRYYYDEVTNSCKLFIYGGCQGNQNNFVNLKDCLGSCLDRCPMIKCWPNCKYGYIFDKDDCRTCSCHSPCANILCPLGKICVAKPCSDYRCKSQGTCVYPPYELNLEKKQK